MPEKIAAKKPVAVKRAASKPVAKAPAVKTTKKPAAQPAEEKTVSAPAKKEKASAKPASSPAKEKAKKPKLVRDSFTMPETEYQVLTDVKKACIKAGFEVKKSELLRVGVALIKRTSTAQLQEILNSLPSLKAGRPKKNK